MRSIGLNPSIQEIQWMMDEVAPGNEGEVDPDQFLILITRKIKETEIEGELKEAFKSLDKDQKGYYNLDDLKSMVF